jgi:hypothetical protein
MQVKDNIDNGDYIDSGDNIDTQSQQRALGRENKMH